MTEAAEIFEEIAYESEEAVEIASEAMQVVSEDLTDLSESVINITDEVEQVTLQINESSVLELLSDDASLMESFSEDVQVSTEEVIAAVEEGGVAGEEIGASAGSRMSTGSALQLAGSDAAVGATGESGIFYRLKQIGGIAFKIVGAYIIVDFVGKTVVSIKDAIEDGTKNPPWKGSLTAEQKGQLVLLADAASKLKEILDGWNAALTELEQNTYLSYGTMVTQVGGRTETVQVIDVVAFLVMDTIQQLTDAKQILDKGVDELSTFDLTQLTSSVFATFSNAQAMIDLRDNKNGVVKDDILANFLFPPPKDDATIKLVLISDFPSWKNSVQNQALAIAKLGATYAVGAFVRSQVIEQVYQYLREHVYPAIREAAKTAGSKAASDYVAGEKMTIVGKALIPIVGPSEAREYGQQVREEAIKRARAAAQAAGKAKAAELQATIKVALEPIVKQVTDQYKLNVKEIARFAAKQILQASLTL